MKTDHGYADSQWSVRCLKREDNVTVSRPEVRGSS
jgi:hypothetical protein